MYEMYLLESDRFFFSHLNSHALFFCILLLSASHILTLAYLILLSAFQLQFIFKRILHIIFSIFHIKFTRTNLLFIHRQLNDLYSLIKELQCPKIFT